MCKSIQSSGLKTNEMTKFRLTSFFAIAFLGISFIFNMTACVAQSTPALKLLAISKSDHILAIIDPATLKVIARLPVGSDPHEVIASADGKTAYVSIYGGGSLHEINVLDLVNQKVLSTINTMPLKGIHGLDFVGDKVWFTAEGSKSIGRYDPATGLFDWSMGTGQDRTHMIYVTPDSKRIYTTNVASGTVSILVDTVMMPRGGGPKGGGPQGLGPQGGGPQGGPPHPPHSDWEQTLVPVGKGSEGFDLSPDGKQLWTVSADEGIITIINVYTKAVIASINAKIMGANRLKITPDGKRVLITSLQNGDLFVYDATSLKEIKHLSTGHGAAGILIDPDGSRAFIGCTADDYVAVVDLKTLKVTDHIDIKGADGLAWAVPAVK